MHGEAMNSLPPQNFLDSGSDWEKFYIVHTSVNLYVQPFISPPFLAGSKASLASPQTPFAGLQTPLVDLQTPQTGPQTP